MEAANLTRIDPVSNAAWSYLHLRSHQKDPDTTIYSYFLTKNVLPKIFTSTHIVLLPFLHAAKIGFHRLWFYPQ